MIDVLLIQPKIGNWDNIRAGFTPPLSLLSISSTIHKDYTIKIVDQRIASNWKQEVKEIIENNNLLCIGITCMIGPQIIYALELSKYIKKLKSKIPIIWGGVQPSLTPELLIKNKSIDIIVKGEGEYTFREICESLRLGSDLNNVKSIFFKKNNNVIETPPRRLLDLNNLPSIPYSLVNMRDYLPKYKNQGTFYFQTSRGCPNKCIFCYNQEYNHGYWRGMDAKIVVERLKLIVNQWKINQFYFVDDNFFADLKRTEEFVTLILKENLNIKWQVQGATIASLLRLEDSLLSKLEKSGLIRISIGVESGSPKILNFIRKNLNIKQIISFNKRMKEYNIILIYNFMVGVPNETNEDIKLTLNLAFKLLKENKKARVSTFFPCAPYPGTELFDFYKKEGYNIKTLDVLLQTFKIHYFTPERNKFLNNIIFLSFFIDKKLSEYNLSHLYNIIKFMLKFYRILAKFRLKYLKFNYLVEKRIFDNVMRIIFKESI